MFPRDGATTPEIRCSEYTDAWEQRKLGEICDFINGDRSSNYPSASDFQENGIPFIGSDSLGTTLIDKNKMRFITQEKYSHMNGIKIQNEDILYTLRGAGFGKCSIADFSEGTVASSLVGIRCKRDILAPKFLVQWFSSSDAECEKQKAVNGSTAQNISVEDMKAYSLKLPKINEQEKIYEYLFSIDNLITLHQRKYDKLVMSKKSMLEKMFPKNGQTKPEIRFSGFIDDWEQRKLGDVAEFSKGSGYSKGDLVEYGTPIILYGRLYTNYETRISDVDTFVEAKVGSVYSKGGEVIVPASGETAEDIARAATVDKSGILLGGDLNIVMPNKDINSSFLAISISSGNPQRELAKKAQGKSVVHIHNEEIKNLVLPFPIKDEQNKIASYFCQLDNLITLHQRELEKLKKIKLSMLEKMFV